MSRAPPDRTPTGRRDATQDVVTAFGRGRDDASGSRLTLVNDLKAACGRLDRSDAPFGDRTRSPPRGFVPENTRLNTPITKVVEMKDISISFGGIKAVDHVSLDLYEGEVLGLVGHNGAGKTVLIKILSGALRRDEGEIFVHGEKARIEKPADAKGYGIETIYQTLALADNVDTAGNLYLGRELLTPFRTLDDLSMEAGAREIMGKLNPRFERFHEPVRALSGGQRQSVAIARAILFDARILIMDEPTAALGPQESAQVADLIKQLTAQGISIILISHDMHDVFDLVDRVTVMKNGRIVGTAAIGDVTAAEVLGMIILGKCAPKAVPGPGATDDVEFRVPGLSTLGADGGGR